MLAARAQLPWLVHVWGRPSMTAGTHGSGGCPATRAAPPLLLSRYYPAGAECWPDGGVRCESCRNAAQNPPICTTSSDPYIPNYPSGAWRAQHDAARHSMHGTVPHALVQRRPRSPSALRPPPLPHAAQASTPAPESKPGPPAEPSPSCRARQPAVTVAPAPTWAAALPPQLQAPSGGAHHFCSSRVFFSQAPFGDKPHSLPPVCIPPASMP